MRANWKTVLEPFGTQYAEMIASFAEACDAMSDEELRRVIAATKRVTQTNCWYASYHAAPLLQEEAKITLHARKQKTRDSLMAQRTAVNRSARP